MDHIDTPIVARRLGGALEPVIGAVYFSPECHANYEALGFSASPASVGGVAMPDGVAYAASRGSLLGHVRGSVVAAAFAVFEPNAMARSADAGWKLADAGTICDARERGAVAQLERVLGRDPVGRDRIDALLQVATKGLAMGPRALAAGAASAPVLDHPLGRIFRHGDVLREFRGDSHNAAWAAEGLDATEIGLLTELYWGLPLRSYTRTRGWSAEQFDRAEIALRERGALDEAGAFTDAGRALREAIEVATDAQMVPVLQRLGDEVHELIELLTPWGVAMRAAGAYLSSGPHDLAATHTP
ncbi:MAG: hypothetical protein AB8G14_02805 [Ilumatobacter sp.]